MISMLRGTLVSKSPTEILVDVNGVGYSVSIPLSTYERIGEVNQTVSIRTHLHVREDLMQLYGFATDEERDLFRLLLSVSGIGPRMAQTILSGISVPELARCISEGNHPALTRIPGVGRKTAERLVLELREKISDMTTDASSPPAAGSAQIHTRSEALLAMVSLGFSRATAERALRAAIQETNGQDATVEMLVKSALRHASGT